MKKLLFSLAFVTGSLMSFSQDNDNENPTALLQPMKRSVFSMGIKGGFGHSFIVPYRNYDFMPSWNAGISAVYSPYEHLGFGMDVLYSREGMKVSNSNESFDVSLNYIRVPMKVIHFFRFYEDDFRPKVSIGPTLGYLTNTEDNDLYNRFDFGANASLGFSYRLAEFAWLHMDAVYNQSLLDYRSGNAENDLNGNVRLELGLCIGF